MIMIVVAVVVANNIEKSVENQDGNQRRIKQPNQML